MKNFIKLHTFIFNTTIYNYESIISRLDSAELCIHPEQINYMETTYTTKYISHDLIDRLEGLTAVLFNTAYDKYKNHIVLTKIYYGENIFTVWESCNEIDNLITKYNKYKKKFF